MTVAEIERIGAPQITRQDARKAYLAYKRAVLSAVKPEDKKDYEGLWRGYKAIAEGQQVLDLGQCMSAAGLQEDTLYPRLAICAADARKCRLQMHTNGSATFADADAGWRNMRRRVAMPQGTFASYETRWRGGSIQRWRPGGTTLERENWREEAQAIVPIVPPQLHPRAALSNYHILWDAVRTPAPPKDPLLLRRLAGSLFAIVAHWDLTALEQAVLRGRL